MRILVCGNRDWTCARTIRAWLERFPPDTTIIHGACPTGADAIAQAIGFELGFDVEGYPADWEAARRAGNVRAAGPIRNQKMSGLALSRGLAFGRLWKPDGKLTGTGDMVQRLNRRGIRVTIVGSEGDLP